MAYAEDVPTLAATAIPRETFPEPKIRVVDVVDVVDLMRLEPGTENPHVRFKGEGTTTTPFDMVMMNDQDSYHLVMDAIDRLRALADCGGHLRQEMADTSLCAGAYTREVGDDMPELRDWVWPFA